jgi:hypothetical protein
MLPFTTAQFFALFAAYALGAGALIFALRGGAAAGVSVNRHANGTPCVECAPAGGQYGRFELPPLVGLPEDGSHDEASVA